MLEIISKFKDKKILVIGDIMLDKYIWGKVNRISPEAPVPIVRVLRESYAPGGAANTANNITSLGGQAIVIATIGNDHAKDILIKILRQCNIKTDHIISINSKPTVQKIRIMAQNQQLLRIDYEDYNKIPEEIEVKVVEIAKKVINHVDGIIISDYTKGMITKNIVSNINKLAKQNNKLLVVDPKPMHKEFYKGVTLITPNYKEALAMLNLEETHKISIEDLGKTLLRELNSTILITRGEAGMSLFEKNGSIIHIPTVAKEVYDVSGAGDTVVATLTLAITSGATFKQAAIIANHAAGIVVGKVGTATLTLEELKHSLENEKSNLLR